MSSKKEYLLNLNVLFSSGNYKIPVYQRNYDWGEAQISQLIEDIYDVANNNNKSVYYIGSLVLNEKDNYYEVLDGQQRLTTLSLLICYLKYKLKNFVDNFNQPSLGFESRPKSNYTIKKLFEKYWNRSDVDKDFYELLSVLDFDRSSPSIVQGFKVIKQVIDNIITSESNITLEDYSKYLLDNVEILRVSVPKNTDVTHYFEVMNNRGEQLEKHEIVKARLLSSVQNDPSAMAVIQEVWLACSNMDRYVQTGFSVEKRKEIFGDTAEEFKFNSFDQLFPDPEVNEPKKPDFFTISESINKYTGPDLDHSKESDDGRKERFSSVIDFPNFLMHVLRIYIIKFNHDCLNNKTVVDSQESNIASLDDKKLLEEFDFFILKDAYENPDIAKDFIYTLLKTRYLFDRYVVKRDSTDLKEGWSLKRYNLDNNGSGYVNTFGADEESQQGDNRRCTMLLSAFHVSYPSHSRKNWLAAVLYWLDCNASFSAEEYLAFLEKLARSFMINRYLVDAPKKHIAFMYKNSILELLPSELSHPDYDPRHYLKYSRVKSFVFNYLDYLLWKVEQRRNFWFSSQDSIEHFSPQNARDNTFLSNAYLHGFGNLCLMGRSENSSLGNSSPVEKVRILDGRKGVSTPSSLKFELMKKYADTWGIHAIHLHEYRMLKKLQAEIGFSMNETLVSNFTQVQNPIYPLVLQELTQGKKRTHWMWFIFPQIAGLGHSEMAQRYALENLTQAQDYLQHEVLGTRLRECAALLLNHPDKTALEIFGTPDNLKLHSSLTLFTLAAGQESVFSELLVQFFAGQQDEKTLQIISMQNK